MIQNLYTLRMAISMRLDSIHQNIEKCNYQSKFMLLKKIRSFIQNGTVNETEMKDTSWNMTNYSI